MSIDSYQDREERIGKIVIIVLTIVVYSAILLAIAGGIIHSIRG